MRFFQSRSIKKFRPLIDALIPDFDYVFLHTILQWCRLADDDNQCFWEVWLIEDRKKVIGICGLYSLHGQKTEQLWLGWFAVLPELRGKGRGRKAMRHLYREAKKVGCKTIMSYVDKAGAPLSFYMREGFNIVGRVGTYVKENSLDIKSFEDPADIVISKPLN